MGNLANKKQKISDQSMAQLSIFKTIILALTAVSAIRIDHLHLKNSHNKCKKTEFARCSILNAALANSTRNSGVFTDLDTAKLECLLVPDCAGVVTSSPNEHRLGTWPLYFDAVNGEITTLRVSDPKNCSVHFNLQGDKDAEVETKEEVEIKK